MITGFIGTRLFGLGARAKDQKDSDFADYASIINVASYGVRLLVKSNLESTLSENLSYSESE